MARAARVGVTPERVLREYAKIAFADISHILKWTRGGIEIADLSALTDDDVAAIREIGSSTGGRPSRVKFYDKKAALDAIARHLGMFPAQNHRPDATAPAPSAEEAREELARLLDRLAAEIGQDGAAVAADGEPTGHTEA